MDAPDSLFWDDSVAYPRYTLRYSKCNHAPSKQLFDKLVGGLADSMPQLKIREYFECKPHIFETSDHLIVAFDQDAPDKACAILATKWHDFPQGEFLHLVTLLIADNRQRSHLIKHLFSYHFRKTADEGKPFPSYIAMKTYNPASYNALRVFSRLPGVSIYPDVTTERQDPMLFDVAEMLSAVLEPSAAFEPETGVIKGAAGNVPRDFWPELQATSDNKVNRYFTARMTPEDRLLSILFTSTDEAGGRILRSLGVRNKESARPEGSELEVMSN